MRSDSTNLLATPLLAGALAVLTAASPIALGATLVLRNGLGGYAGTEDTVIRQDAPDTNSGGSLVADINGPTPTPALLKFKGLDILQGHYSSIDSVTLTLTQYPLGTKPAEPFTVRVLQVADANAGWTQGTQDNQAANAGSATWNSLAHGSTPWVGGPGLTGAGGTAGQIGAFDLTPQTGSPQYVISLDPAAIVHWIEGGSNNAGMYLDQLDAVSAWWGFQTSNSLNAAVRPTLTIEYTPAPEPAAGRFRFGWWDSFGNPSANKMGAQGATFAVNYNATYPEADVRAWLDFAGANGIKVIADVSPTLVDSGNTGAIRGFVQTFDAHPAVDAWFIYDEPSFGDYNRVKAAYDAVKLDSSKPVAIVFGSQAPFNGVMSTFANACDIVLIDSYPCRAGEAEFNTSRFNSFKATMDSTAAHAASLNKPWGAVLQAFGREPGSASYRLPTFREARFMTYYVIHQGASSAVFYPLYRTEIAPAVPGDPYPHGGVQWQSDVFEPLADEMAALDVAIGAGAIGGLVTDNAADIRTSLYQNPDTGEYFLLALNITTGSENPTITVNLAGVTHARLLFEGTEEVIPLVGGQFTDQFAAYGVHVYQLVPEPASLLLWGMAALCLARRDGGGPRCKGKMP